MERIMKVTKRQCLFAFFSAAIVVICVCVGVTMNLTTLYDENFDHMGIRTFCMFTVNSNILCAVSMAMVIPYTLDGRRKHNYHLPRWITRFVYMGVTGVGLTFVISLLVLSPVKGFFLIFTGSRFFLHGLCPILAIVAFCFFMSEQELTFRDNLLVLLPVFLYACLYFVMVVLIGEEAGGWNDFYGFVTRVPMWIPMVLFLPITFLIAWGLRALHNRSFLRREVEEASACREAFANADPRRIAGAMARANSLTVKMADVLVPTRVLSIILENSNSDATLEECSEIYLKEYFAAAEALKIEKMWL